MGAVDCGFVSCEWPAARVQSAARAAATEMIFMMRICKYSVNRAVPRVEKCVLASGCLPGTGCVRILMDLQLVQCLATYYSIFTPVK